MSVDGLAEKAAVRTRLGALCGGHVYQNPSEAVKLAVDADGAVVPYIIVTFGAMYPIQTDRSIEGAAEQPLILPIIVECWAGDPVAPEATAGAVRTLLLGWTPGTDGNASEIDLRAGGSFDTNNSSGRPSRFMESVIGVTTINNSIVVA